MYRRGGTRSIASPRRGWALLAVSVALVLAACGAGTPTGTPTMSTAKSTPTANPSSASSPTLPIASPGPLGQFAFIRPVATTDIDPDIWLATVWPGSADGGFTITTARLTDDPGVETGLAWSPDGTRLAFTRRVGVTDTLWLVHADGSGQMQLASDASADVAPSWSPDGRRLVFQREDDDGRSISVVSADGSGLARLTDDGLSDAAAWSPTRDLIAFRRGVTSGLDDPSPTTSLWLMGSDGTGDRAITFGVETVAAKLAWSPDGTWIAFGRYFSTPPTTSTGASLHVISVDGSRVLRLTDGSSLDREPVWAPDGTMVMFERVIDLESEQETADIWVVNADGSGAHKALASDTTDFGATWSPDGRLIACMAESGAAGGGIAILSADGTGMTIVEPEGSLPAWRPGS